jgi:hypothetical protein
MATVNFNLPSPYESEMADIARRQRMAELMQQQAFQPAETFSYGGIQARTSPLTGIAKALQGYTSMKMQKDLANEQKALGEKYRTQSAEEGSQFLSALRGTPATKGTEGVKEYDYKPNAFDLEQNPQLLSNLNLQQQADVDLDQMPTLTSPAQKGLAPQPAVGPDLARALQLSMGSVNPMVQSAGGSLLATMTKPKEVKWEKAELPQPDGSVKTGWVDVNSPNPATTFVSGGNKEPELVRQDTGREIITLNKTTGQRVTNIPSITKDVDVNTAATLAQTQANADRAFNNLSVFQKADLANRARQLGISERQLFLNEYQAQNPAMSFQETDGGAMAFNPRTGTATPVLTPAGTPLQSSRPLTESQGKATNFATRANEADQILNNIGQGGAVQPGLLKRAGESIPFVGAGVGSMLNVTQSPQQQQVEQAQRNFVNAILRQESGAAIGKDEFASAQAQYFPQPGDSAEVIAQKAANRRSQIAGLSVQAGPGIQRASQMQQQTQQPMRAKNPTTGQEIISTDGGKTWKPVQGAQ